MIEDLYILDDKKNVLYGDPSKIRPVLDPKGESSLLLTTLRCNHVFLGALYTDFHPLHVIQMLKVVAKHLPADLDPEKVKGRYFAIFEMLQKHCAGDVFLKDPGTTQILPTKILRNTDFTTFGSRNEVFLDIVEKFTAILDTDLGTVRSDVVGKVLCRTSMAKPAEIHVPIVHDKSVEFLSNNRYSYDGHVRTFRAMGYGSFVVATYIKMDADPPVLLRRTDDGYEAVLKMPMERIKVTIPVQKTAYNVQASPERGTAKYFEKKSAVEWQISNPRFRNAKLSLRTDFLDEEDVGETIRVEFSGQGGVCSVSAKSIKSEVKVDSYVKYRIESGCYEIRDSPA